MVYNISGFCNLRPSFEDDFGIWVLFDDFYDVLKSHHISSDQKLQKSNLTKIFWKNKGNAKDKKGKLYITTKSILKFIFSHCEQIHYCSDAVNEIHKKLLFGSSKESDRSVLRIYNQIVTNLSFAALDNIFVTNSQITENSIETLHLNYKKDFPYKDWLKICLFEYHYSNYVSDQNSDYDNDLDNRYRFYEEMVNAMSVSKTLKVISKSVIRHRIQRTLIASTNENVSLKVIRGHDPILIDYDLAIKFRENVNWIICVDCVSSCNHPPSLHVYVEVKDVNDVIFEYIVSEIKTYLKITHMTPCYHIIFFTPGTVEQFKDTDNNISRFLLRDSVIHHNLKGKMCFEYIEDTFDFDYTTLNASVPCQKCYGHKTLTPLHWKTFDWRTEWCLETPLMVQVVLGSFLADKSFKTSENPEILIEDKITKLYSLFDALLNVSNKKYIGLFQLKNTQELSMNYNSIQTVFSVTGSTGSTLSLRTAEKKLKECATDDKCYYNTYLKEYPIRYHSINGMQTHSFRIRDSLLVLLMDNLVRLKYHSDPSPSESRSMQMCTLPLTIMGIPTEQSDVQSWHEQSLCDGQAECLCMKDTELKKEDIDNKMLHLLPDEKETFNRFKRMLTWGFTTIWKKITEGDWLEKHLNVEQKNDLYEEQELLEDSFLNMTLESQSDVDSSDEECFDTETATGNFEAFNDSAEIISIINDNVCAEDEDGNGNVCDEDEDDGNADNIFCNHFPKDSHDSDPSIDQKTNSLQDCESLSTVENESVYGELEVNSIAGNYGFSQHTPPAYLTRHPKPAKGRDDDITILKGILEDILIKTGRFSTNSKLKILCAPDNKIGKNLLKLINSDRRFGIFLPEFPILHLRKSKINTLCTAYKDAGLIEIFKYMRDEEVHEWKKLISAEHIDKASRYIRRISMALHTAFLLSFVDTLSLPRQEAFFLSMKERQTEVMFCQEYNDFVAEGMERNATFLLHWEMMQHCDEIVALTFSERLGGREGYQLLLSSVKSSLAFSYLNGASAYASFSTQLLYQHYKSGPFYQRFKEEFYTTPHKDSQKNFGLDTQREMDHKDVIKSFRSGSTMASVLPRMSLVDSLNEIHESSIKERNRDKKSLVSQDELLGLQLNQKDMEFILRVTSLVLRRGGLSTEEDRTVKNVYSVQRKVLPNSILDFHTTDIGRYLIKKHAMSMSLFGLGPDDIPDIQVLSGPKELISRVKRSKGVTVKRTTETQIKIAERNPDQKRLNLLKRETARIKCMSSAMNTCQAVVSADCSKPKVLKSTGIKQAIKNIFMSTSNSTSNQDTEMLFEKLVTYNVRTLTEEVKDLAKYVTIEFAGVKFKASGMVDGEQYLKYIERAILQKITIQMPFVERIAICEEKYSFTPDDFKAATRNQRSSVAKTFPISHLKTTEEILLTFDRKSITSTYAGKKLISTYLARHMDQLNIKKKIEIDVDSELHVSDCSTFTTPIRCLYTATDGFVSHQKLKSIKQSKGEAEMSQIDWLMEYASELSPGDVCVSIVTSGDIDAVVLHLFFASWKWKRNENGRFINPIYVILQKPAGMCDVYNITGLLEILETSTKDMNVGIKLGVALSLGGNDFLPKFHGITHSQVVETIFKNPNIQEHFLNIDHGDKMNISVDPNIYKEILKTLYCPRYLNSSEFSFAEIRQMSVSIPQKDGKVNMKNPQKWMPPETAIDCLVKNINCLINYYLTAGSHHAPIPDFLKEGCLLKNSKGDVDLDLGPDVHVKDTNFLFIVKPRILLDKIIKVRESTACRKRKSTDTPQKGTRRKARPKTSTPKKQNSKRQDLSSLF